jgi:hypothetical protein
MGLFAGKDINKYRSSKGGNYLGPGRYVGRLLSAKGILYGQPTPTKEAFVAEFEILEVIGENSTQVVGEQTSHFVKLSDTDFPDTAYGNVADCMRAMVACADAAEGNAPDSIDSVDIDDETAEVITSKDQPMAGTIMGISAVQIKTKKGHDFTKISYFVPENVAAYYQPTA